MRHSILLVGAGAVGQAYGWHFQRGGAEVAFLTRERHAAAARAGFRLYPGGAPRPVRFAGFDVLTSLEEVRARDWEAVVLCVPSPALREGDWLDQVIATTGQATVVTLQPGLTDFDHVAARAGERAVAGMVGLLAWAAPLPGRVGAPGTAFWWPPGGRCPLSGAAERVAPLVTLLRAGGLPAVEHADVPRALAFGAAVLEPHVAALECAGFDLARLRGDRELLATARAASREAAAVAAAWRGGRVPWHVGRLPMRLLLRLAPLLAPIDLEGFLRAHYSKVRAQTRRGLAEVAEVGGQHGVATPALRALGARLEARA